MKRAAVAIGFVLAVAITACSSSDKTTATSASSTIAPVTTAAPGATYTGDKGEKQTLYVTTRRVGADQFVVDRLRGRSDCGGVH